MLRSLSRTRAVASATEVSGSAMRLNLQRSMATKATGDGVEFGYNTYVFDLEGRTKSATAREWAASIKEGRQMNSEAANELAEELLAFAKEHNASYYAHWASPVRGPVALVKHQTFMDYEFDSKGKRYLSKGLSGSKLFNSEADGSSFPNGGLRDTHAAAGYLTWDKTSPPFIRGETLYIPSGFVSWNGDALDEKTPLLRSADAIDREGKRLLRLLGDEQAEGIDCNLGVEQEFFLIDRDHYEQRPDLKACGRTLIGAPPARGQQMDTHYFSALPGRVSKCLEAAEREMQKVGVVNTVFHSEVAPAQFEFAPLFFKINVSADKNMLAMDILQEAAIEHGLQVLYHEKPFAGVNGSGKHSNWSLIERRTGRQLFVPGKSDADQQSFMAMMACMLRTLHVHGDLIRTSVGSAGNDHRLGAQEAPPAIMSLYFGHFLGEHVQRIIDDAEATLEGYNTDKKDIPFSTKAMQDARGSGEDRNRTAPFPFCGNRFEFRAVGSNQHVGFPMTCVQSAMAESMSLMSEQIESGKSVKEVVRQFFVDHAPAMFNGNGYSAEWQQVDAPSRGLVNLPTTVDALDTLCSDKNTKMFQSVGVFNPHEVHARQEILYEQYTNTMLIEANCLLDMMEKGALPACAQDLQKYAGSSAGLEGARPALYSALRENVNKLSAAIDAFPAEASSAEHARYALEVIKPIMVTVREHSDQAERLIPEEAWPYPSYQNVLYQVATMGKNDAGWF